MHLQPDSIPVWPLQSPEHGLAQLATAQAEKAAERAREEGQRVKKAKAEAEAQQAEVDTGTTEAAKKARDAARQARKIASEAKAKAQVGMPFVDVLGSCTPWSASHGKQRLGFLGCKHLRKRRWFHWTGP